MTERVITSISIKELLKRIDFNEYLVNKRKIKNSQSISLPNQLYQHIDVSNKSKFVAEIIEKYRLLLTRSEKDIFFTFDDFIRFFLYLDYFFFVNDLELMINSKGLLKKEKNGLLSEIENGIEYLREYDNGKIIKQNVIRGYGK